MPSRRSSQTFTVAAAYHYAVDSGRAVVVRPKVTIRDYLTSVPIGVPGGDGNRGLPPERVTRGRLTKDSRKARISP
jgi:hypothetical protein